MNAGRPPGRLAAVLGVALIAAYAVALSTPVAVAAPATPGSGVPTGSPVRSVHLTIEALYPKVVKRSSTIEISGRLTNRTRHPITALGLRLQAGPAISSRAALHAAVATPPPTDFGGCPFVDQSGPLAPGGGQDYTVRCSARALGLDRAGVYPVLVNLNATQFDGTVARVGEAGTFLPFFPTAPKHPVQVSWLWPITARPHELPSGVFADDFLATSFDSGGLFRSVAVARHAPAGVDLTVAIDPALLLAAQTMSARTPYRVQSPTGSGTYAGAGRQAARSWLAAVRALAEQRNVTITALPYADPDLVALRRADQTAIINRAYARGSDVLRTTLDISATPRIAWPVGGELDDATLDTVAAEEPAAIVLSPDAVSGSVPAAAPVVSLPTPSAEATGIISDGTLSALATPDFSPGVRADEQRFLAELAIIAATSRQSHTIVVAPAHNWSPGREYAGSLLTDTASVPWIRSVSVGTILRQPPADGHPLRYPSSAGNAELPPAVTARIGATSRQLDGFGSALDNADARRMLLPSYDGLLAAAAAAWRRDTVGSGRFLASVSRQLGRLTRQVFVVPPTQGTYSLASTKSPLVITIQNSLGTQVTVRVRIAARGTTGFRARPSASYVIPRRSRPTIRVPSSVQRAGVFRVTVSLTTPAGTDLGQVVDLRVHSTAYGRVAIGITGGALALLFVLVARRLYRRLRGRGGPAGAARGASADLAEPVEP